MPYEWSFCRKETPQPRDDHLSSSTKNDFGMRKLLIWITHSVHQMLGKAINGSEPWFLYLQHKVLWGTPWRRRYFQTMMQHWQMLLLIKSHEKWMVGCTFCILLQGKCSAEILLSAKRILSHSRILTEVLKSTSVDFPKTSNLWISGGWQF